jgi:deoxyribodipyrimidine photo-lyase
VCPPHLQDTIPAFAASANASAVVTDMSPLRVPAAWVKDVGAALDEQSRPLIQVDAHNIVPVWTASPKQEVGARTLRPKIHNLLPTFLTEMPPLTSNAALPSEPPLVAEEVDWEATAAGLEVDRSVEEVP